MTARRRSATPVISLLSQAQAAYASAGQLLASGASIVDVASRREDARRLQWLHLSRLGHIASSQGSGVECASCGASGSIDRRTGAITGAIWTNPCQRGGNAA